MSTTASPSATRSIRSPNCARRRRGAGAFEHTSLLVDKPGGLTPGIHRIAVAGRIRYSYFPPDVQVSMMRAERLGTVVMA